MTPVEQALRERADRADARSFELVAMMSLICGTDTTDTLRTATANLVKRYEATKSLLKRYLDNHCQLSDQEGTSALCECKLCKETRGAITS